jgi:hypothetical protein
VEGAALVVPMETGPEQAVGLAMDLVPVAAPAIPGRMEAALYSDPEVELVMVEVGTVVVAVTAVADYLGRMDSVVAVAAAAVAARGVVLAEVLR